MTRPIAYILCGGGGRAAANHFVTSWQAWAAGVGPRLWRCGITRVHLQNPGGIWPQPVSHGDRREMRVDQWLLAERAGLPFARRRDFAAGVQVLTEHGVREVICYIGSPTQLADVERQLPRCVEPYLAAGPTVSLAFDAIFHDGVGHDGNPAGEWRRQWEYNSPLCRALGRVREECQCLYSEPRLTAEHVEAGLGALVDGTIADAAYDFGPHFGVDLSIQPGETIRISDPRTEARWKAAPWWPETAAWSPGVTTMYRSDLNWGPLLDAYPVPGEFVERNKR